MKNTLYRKLLYVISMVLLSLVAVLLFRPEEGIFRMHVIANSDSAADQATKLAVRDAILDYERGMGNVGSAEEVKARLMDDGRGICTAIDNVLHERTQDVAAHQRFTLEDKITPVTPPVFVWHTMEDETVPVENTLLLLNALHKAGVPCEAHLFEKGCHGTSISTPEVDADSAHRNRWVKLAVEWLDDTFSFHA